MDTANIDNDIGTLQRRADEIMRGADYRNGDAYAHQDVARLFEAMETLKEHREVAGVDLSGSAGDLRARAKQSDATASAIRKRADFDTSPEVREAYDEHFRHAHVMRERANEIDGGEPEGAEQ